MSPRRPVVAASWPHRRKSTARARAGPAPYWMATRATGAIASPRRAPAMDAPVEVKAWPAAATTHPAAVRVPALPTEQAGSLAARHPAGAARTAPLPACAAVDRAADAIPRAPATRHVASLPSETTMRVSSRLAETSAAMASPNVRQKPSALLAWAEARAVMPGDAVDRHGTNVPRGRAHHPLHASRAMGAYACAAAAAAQPPGAAHQAGVASHCRHTKVARRRSAPAARSRPLSCRARRALPAPMSAPAVHRTPVRCRPCRQPAPATLRVRSSTAAPGSIRARSESCLGRASPCRARTRRDRCATTGESAIRPKCRNNWRRRYAC